MMHWYFVSMLLSGVFIYTVFTYFWELYEDWKAGGYCNGKIHYNCIQVQVIKLVLYDTCEETFLPKLSAGTVNCHEGLSMPYSSGLIDSFNYFT